MFCSCVYVLWGCIKFGEQFEEFVTFRKELCFSSSQVIIIVIIMRALSSLSASTSRVDALCSTSHRHKRRHRRVKTLSFSLQTTSTKARRRRGQNSTIMRATTNENDNDGDGKRGNNRDGRTGKKGKDVSPLSELQRLSEEQPREWTESYNKITLDDEEEEEGRAKNKTDEDEDDEDEPKTKLLSGEWLENEKTSEATALANEALVMFAASFVLGPLLDHQHSRFDVLHYAHPVSLDMNIILAPILHNPLSEQFISVFSGPIGFFFVGESGTIETDWWVGPLFGVAGIIMGLGTTTLDSIFLRNGVKARRIKEIEGNLQPVRTKALIAKSPAKPAGGWEPSWGFTLASISFFALQYAASGMLASPDFDFLSGGEGHLPYHSIDVFLLLWAAGAWAYFDKTYQGLVIAGAAAVGGPIIEIVLINVFHLYTYTNPDIFGIPSWIPWVYACGGPAVGNLSRTARGKLRAFLNLAGPVCRVPIYESRPSWRPPPRGFDPRTFRASGVKRNAGDDQMKGKFVILVDGPVDLTGVQSLDDIDAKKIFVSAGRRYGAVSEDDAKDSSSFSSSPSGNEKPKMPRFQRVRNLFKRFRKNGKGKKDVDEEMTEEKDEKEKEAEESTSRNEESIAQKLPPLLPTKQPLLLPATSSNQKIEQKLLPLEREEKVDGAESATQSTNTNTNDDIKTPREKAIAQPALSKDERVLDVKRRMAEVESQIEELEKLKTLKVRLTEMKMQSEDASPPIGPKIQRARAKITESVPELLQPSVKKMNESIDKVTEKIITSNPKIKDSRVVRKLTREDNPEERLRKIKALKENLKRVQKEDLKPAIEMMTTKKEIGDVETSAEAEE